MLSCAQGVRVSVATAWARAEALSAGARTVWGLGTRVPYLDLLGDVQVAHVLDLVLDEACQLARLEVGAKAAEPAELAGLVLLPGRRRFGALIVLQGQSYSGIGGDDRRLPHNTPLRKVLRRGGHACAPHCVPVGGAAGTPVHPHPCPEGRGQPSWASSDGGRRGGPLPSSCSSGGNGGERPLPWVPLRSRRHNHRHS